MLLWLLADPAEHVKLSEADFLSNEASQAKKAMAAVAHEMVGSVGSAVDPRPIVGKHPWMSLGAAAVAGFVGAAMVTHFFFSLSLRIGETREAVGMVQRRFLRRRCDYHVFRFQPVAVCAYAEPFGSLLQRLGVRI